MAESTTPDPAAAAVHLCEALDDPDSSVRLQVAMAAGTRPEADYVGILVARCATEPDFYVRDMLTWALTRHPVAVTIPFLLTELEDGAAQARSQALHTLSKIGDPRGWQAITPEVLQDPDDEVARSAWRAAVALAPHEARAELAATLVMQLGRGDRDVRMSLSRALVGLGTAADSVLADAATHGNAEARTHAIATQRLLRDPDEGFEASVFEAERLFALMDVPAQAAPSDEASPQDPHAHQ